MTLVIGELRALFNHVCEVRNQTSPASALQLKDHLVSKNKIFAKLLDNTPKNAERLTILQSGKATVEGTEYRLNDDFTKQALFLSDQLDVDEFEAVRLLLGGISCAPTMNTSALDASVYLYHEERNYVLTILNVILESVKNQTLEPTIRTIYSTFIANLIEEQGSFVSKILKSTKELSDMISSLSKTGQLKSVTPAPTQQPQQPQTLFQQPQQPQQPPQPAEEIIKFGPDTTTLRIDRLTDERIYLVQVLYHICSLYWIPEPELIALLTHVQSTSLSNATCSYVLIALMSALSTTHQKQLTANSFVGKEDYVRRLHENITTKAYKVSALKASVQIQWALSVAEMDKLHHSITAVMDNVARIKYVEEAIKLEALGFMNDYLLYFKQNKFDRLKQNTIQDMDLDDSAMAIDGLIVDPNDYTKFEAEICLDFQKFVVHELESMTRSFILNMYDFFLGLKKATSDELAPATVNQEEDANPLGQFLTLLGSVYRDRLNAGLEFWQAPSPLSQFVPWLLDFKLLNSLSGYFDFFAAIATGEQCAPLAHDMMKIGINRSDIFASHLFSWGKLFGALQFYVEQYRERTAEDEPPTLPVNEEEPLCKLLNFCQQVIQYSDKARIAIWNESVLDTHNSIVGLIGCPTSTRLRAALYNLLGAFCTNWGGGINQYGQQISFAVWNTLECSDMVIPNKVMTAQPPAAVTSTASFEIPKPLTPNNTLFGNAFNSAASISERMQAQSIINQPVTTKPTKHKPSPARFLLDQPAGFLREFEDEKSRCVYSETLAFLKMMASLIHTESKRDELISGFAPPKSSIPFCLGKDNQRSPGTAPYISLIVDHIFLNLKNLHYQYAENRWQLADACLQVIENSIMSFDIGPIVDFVHYENQKEPATVLSFIDALEGKATEDADGQNTEIIQQALLGCVTHPGFDIIIRILSGGALIHELFKIVEKGRDAISEKCKTKAGKNMDFKKCMTRCLRIFNKVFELQNAFVNIFMPQLGATVKYLPMGQYKLGLFEFPLPPPSLRSLGKHMLHNNEVIVQIALMVNCEDEEDICRLSTSVLTWLASEPEEYTLHVKFPDHINVPMGGIGSQLAGILMSSHSAGEIVLGFGERVQIDSAKVTTYDDYEYDINVIPFWLAEKTLNDVYRYKDDDPSRLTSSVNVAILEMLLKTVEKSLPSPTMTEFLLGFNTDKYLEIKGFQYRTVGTDKRSRLACLYAILDMVRTGASNEETPMIVSHPVLAEKCYQLIYKLCARKSTSATMLQYLRNDGDFLTKQFTLISSRLENQLDVSQSQFEGLLISAGHTHVRTDYLTMVSVLHQRAWLLQLIALELHRNRGSSTLLNLLYGGASTNDANIADQLNGLSLGLQDNYQQPLWNMVEIINSLDFTWIDGLDDGQEHKEAPTTSNTFKKFDAKRYTIKKDGYELYDIRTIFKILRQYETSDLYTKTLSDQNRHALEFEMGNLLKQYMAENRHREISYGRLHCLRAWKQVVEITLSDCFDASFTFEYRKRIIYDLLAVLLPKLHEDNALQNDMLKGLSEVILSLLTRLQEDKRRQAVLKVGESSVDIYELPNEKLRNIFYLIIKSICKENSTIEVRSTLYSSLVNVLQYITPARNDHIIQLIRDNHKLLGIICGDAAFGQDEFRITAFTMLESIYVLMGQQGTAVMHGCFTKDNFLKYVIEKIKRSDDNFIRIIAKRDVSLLGLDIHEAIFSFFMQIALNREGAALLLKSGLLYNLSDCKFINVRLEEDVLDNGFKLKDNPNAHERYGRLLIPVLELINVILKSLTGIQGAEILQIETWIKHQDVILNILKDDSTTTLSSLYILQLATMFMYQLSCKNGFFESLEKRGLHLIDAALIKLIPKYCQCRNWASSVAPTNDKEKAWAKEKFPDTVNNSERTVFVVEVDKLIAEIKNNLLGYAQKSTFRSRKLFQTEPFKPIFTNTLREDYIQFPSLTNLSSCISSTGKQLSLVIAEFSSLCAQKENVASLKYEEIQEIAHTAIPNDLGITFDSLNPTQQTQVLIDEIDLRREQKMKELRSLFYTIENAIFILWPHLEFYLNRDSISKSTNLSPCERYANEQVVLLHQSLFQTSTVKIQQLKEDCQLILEPIFQKLELIVLPSSSLQNTTLPVLYKLLRKCYQS